MMQRELDAAVAKRLGSIVAEYRMADQPDVVRAGPMKRRRGFVAQDYSGLATLTLVRDDGLLRWIYQPPARNPMSRRARRGAIRTIGAEPVYEFSFKETPPNQVILALTKLDEKLTPGQGLKRLKSGRLEPADKVKIDGRVLLLVHGTFSKCDMFIDELNSIASGKDLLNAGQKRYEAILAFDHPTLSVSPWANAIDLEEALENVTGPIDVICHSRGGLVVAWWLRNPKRQVDNVVFVGAPLVGTSLASPASLRGALQVFANILQGLEHASALASTVNPFAVAVTGLSKILGGILRLGANTPLADAAVVMVPGLAGQSRVGNNAELLRLTRRPWASTPSFHAVTSNFQPWDNDAAWWEIWKHLNNPGGKLLDWGADMLFQDKNDLVVDTQSMTVVCGTQITQVHNCDSRKVHHCNYFRQDETVATLKKALKL
ncbi:triacylglycerol lipase [Bradyrhizobium sp. Cp5.3]|uniref:esterase/lipase family protein n=1 Tax=Bradyrhizobium sp. Cp5.3 TaxID=443598 RepID=UPI000487255E|nr:alpha/beta fold hydrolase [Bradyrhizobium sp. Cp5.3]